MRITFNSLSRDHEMDRARFDRAARISLSTPSLGITGSQGRWPAGAGAARPFQLPLSGSQCWGKDIEPASASHPLSTPSLGITSPFEQRTVSGQRLGASFQLPLSGSPVSRNGCPAGPGGLAFNSLSRDHRNQKSKTRCIMNSRNLSTPSLGITGSQVFGGAACLLFNTFNSLSRDHCIACHSCPIVRVSCGRPFNSLSRDH